MVLLTPDQYREAIKIFILELTGCGLEREGDSVNRLVFETPWRTPELPPAELSPLLLRIRHLVPRAMRDKVTELEHFTRSQR